LKESALCPASPQARVGVPQHSLTRTNIQSKKLLFSAGRSRPSAADKVRKVVPERVAWSHEQFTAELAKAKRVGPGELSNDALVSFCRGSYQSLRRLYWRDAGPFFVELRRRVKGGLIPNIPTMRAACDLLGCSTRTEQRVVKETVGRSTNQETNKKQTEREEMSRQETDSELVQDIQRYAFRKLRRLRGRESDRLRDVSKLVAEHCRRAARIEHIDDLDPTELVAPVGPASEAGRPASAHG